MGPARLLPLLLPRPALPAWRRAASSLGPVVCRAAVAHGQGAPLQVEEVEVAAPGPGQLRLRMASASICQSDPWVWRGGDGGMLAPFPVILGHEGAGTVEAVGEGVVSHKVGDSVIPCGLPHCGQCALCLHPTGQGCAQLARAKQLASGAATCRSAATGARLHPLMALGTFAEYIVVPAVQAAVVPAAAPLHSLSHVGCAVLTGWGAARAVAKVEAGSKVAVWGAGAVGLSAIMACREAGAGTIVALDLQPGKLEMAERCGATHTVPGGPRAARQVMVQCVESLHPGWGEAVLVGLPPGAQRLDMPALPFILQGLSLRGSMMGGWPDSLAAIQELVRGYMERGSPDLDLLVTREIQLEDINEAFVALEQEGSQELRVRVRLSG